MSGLHYNFDWSIAFRHPYSEWLLTGIKITLLLLLTTSILYLYLGTVLAVMLASCLAAVAGPDTTLLWDMKPKPRDNFDHLRLSAPKRTHSLQTRLAYEIVVVTNEPGGIGMVIGAAPEGARVIRVAPGTPACQGGVQASDLITGIDAMPIVGTGLLEIALRLRGPVGSEVDLTLTRKGRTLPLRVKLWREEISLEKVNSSCE
jgi:hypothetical protein